MDNNIKIDKQTESVRVSKDKLARLRGWKGVYGNITDLMDRGLDLVIAECREKDVKLGRVKDGK